MNRILVLVVLFAGFIGAPVAAQDSCIPKESRDNAASVKTKAVEELTAARKKLEESKSAENSARGKGKDIAKRNTSSAETLVREMEIRESRAVKTADGMAMYSTCATSVNPTPAIAAAEFTSSGMVALTKSEDLANLSELSSLARFNKWLLIALVGLVVAAIVGQLLSLRAILKRTNQMAKESSERGSNSSNPSQTVATPENGSSVPQLRPNVADHSPDYAGGHAKQDQYASGNAPDRPPPAPAPQISPPPFAPIGLISNGNNGDSQTERTSAQAGAVSLIDDFDDQLTEPEIWAILLPQAANLMETLRNLDSANLTRELLASINQTSPSLARNLHRIGFQLISGRLAPNGKEVSRNAEMFAIELAGRTLLFPSPRSKYKQAFDTFFEGANTENWRGCIQPARVQKTVDNLLVVIERGVSGR